MSIRTRHLFFDFFGTLVGYRDGVLDNPCARAGRELADDGVHVDPHTLRAAFDAAFRALEIDAAATLREFSMHDAARKLYASFGRSPPADRLGRFVDAYLEDWCEGVSFDPTVPALLDAIDLPMSVVSNTHDRDIVPRLLAHAGLGRRFERVITSIDHGYRKPHPSIYRHALDAARVEPEAALFVGDNPECDFHGPARAGMRSVLLAVARVDGVDARIATLHELPALLAR